MLSKQTQVLATCNPHGVKFWYFKIRLFDLEDSMFGISKVYDIELQRYRNQNLRQNQIFAKQTFLIFKNSTNKQKVIKPSHYGLWTIKLNKLIKNKDKKL